MWYKVKELLSQNYKVCQVARILGLHRHTVSKYKSMSEEEFLHSGSYDRHYCHKLDGYSLYVENELRTRPYLSAPQIHDRLKENFENLPEVSPKTVFNFVEHIRRSHNLPKSPEKIPRPYEKQPETPYGEYAQADFGERWMPAATGRSVKVYFFAMSLSRSRYKFVHFSQSPFTTSAAVYAHELAFSFYGGVPRKIVYDQDRVFVSHENLGDFVLAKGFRSLVCEHGFTPVFCRKGDPESKGKIENVVKYVKYNFLRGREFTDIRSLNKSVLGWLDRTANGTKHHGTRLVPSEEFAKEKKHLLPYDGTPSLPEEALSLYHVRKDNVVNYRGNYYTVPTGTYRGHGSVVYIEDKDGMLHIYSRETGKTVATHRLSQDKGKLVRNTSHLRDRETPLKEYESAVRRVLPDDGAVDEYLEMLHRHKARTYRDNLQFISRRAGAYTERVLREAFARCLEAGVFNGCDLMNVAESLRLSYGEQPVENHAGPELVPSADLSGMDPEKTDISTFTPFFI